MRGLPLLLLLCMSCYHAGIASGTFTCDQPGDLCPDGQVCSGGLCVNPGDVPDSGGAEDLTVSGPADLTVSGPVDMKAGGPPDMTVVASPDLMPDPCSAGWTEIVPKKVYACSRSFTVANGNFDNLCRSGYHVCSAMDDLGGVSGPAGTNNCKAAGGFFTTQIDIALQNADSRHHTADGNCSPGRFDYDRALLGCGTVDGLYQLSAAGCSMLNTAQRCFAPLMGWSCSSVQTISHSTMTGGLLCCVTK